MNNPNDWLIVLAEECERSSQTRVARRLSRGTNSVSTAVICQVLSGKYPSPTTRLQALVEGAFMNRTVECPILGELPLDKCLSNQALPFAAINYIRVQLYKACRNNCPNAQGKEEI